MPIAYFDCQVGASGDMILGALLDAGAPIDAMRDAFADLPSGMQVTIDAEQVQRGGLHAMHATVGGQLSPETGRSFVDLMGLADRLRISGRLMDQGRAVLMRLGEAEARVHGVPLEEVHLHELGSLDTLVDVFGAVIGLDALGVTEVHSAPIPAGRGTVRSQHGPLLVPAPAVMELAVMAGAPLRTPHPQANTGELVTPTGAAILTTLGSFLPIDIVPQKVGYGAGSRDPETYPNVLGMWVGEVATNPLPADGQSLITIETNIDDMNPEIYGYLRERLTAAGARDVWYTPVQMKKDRPGVTVGILAPAVAEGRMLQILFEETSTLGARVQPVRRPQVDRDVVVVRTSLGDAAVKLKRVGGRIVSAAPEYEEARRLAEEAGMPLQDVYRIVQRAAEDEWLDRA